MSANRLHYPLEEILDEFNEGVAGAGSYAAIIPWSPEAECAVVFVHGFAGGPTSTWEAFPRILPDQPALERADFYFYGYPSVRFQVGVLANHLNYFLERTRSGQLRTAALQGAGLEALPTKPYTSFVIVAHSLGGLIIRVAVLYALRERKTWSTQASLVLFAPAHCGARIGTVGIQLLSALPGLKMLGSLLGYLIPSGTDLDPSGSPILKAVRQETEHLGVRRKAGTRSPLQAFCVFGAKDKIVVVDHYTCDTRYQPDPWKAGHFDICKPRGDWTFPLECLLRAVPAPRATPQSKSKATGSTRR